MTPKKKEDKDKIIKTLYSELQRKDKQIDKLKEDNKILMGLALRYAEKKEINKELMKK